MRFRFVEIKDALQAGILLLRHVRDHVGVVGLICRGLVQRLVRPSPRVRRLQRLLEKLVLRLRHGGVGGALHDATRRQTPSVYRRALRP